MNDSSKIVPEHITEQVAVAGLHWQVY